MSTGSGFHGEAPGAGDQPSREAGDAPGHGDDGTFADVFNGFALDAGRGRRKRKKNKEPADSAAGTTAAENPTDQGDRVTSVVSPPGGSSTRANAYRYGNRPPGGARG